MKTYKEAFALLLEKQSTYQFQKRRKKEALYQRIPELSSVDQEININGVALTRATISGDFETAEKIRQKMIDLEEKKKVLARGYEDLITPTYFCSVCQDTGLLPDGICQCLNQCLAELSFSSYDLKARAQRETFDHFNPDYYPDQPLHPGGTNPRTNALNIKQNMLKYCQNFDTIQDQLLFTGPPGVGKTFVSNCIVNHLTEKGYSIIYVTAAHLVSSIQDQLFREKKTAAEIFEPLLLCDLLIIDDLGAEFSSEYSQKQLYEVIDSRLNAEKNMIISSNLTVLKIKELYDERLSSRIYGNFKIIPFQGEDIRILKARRGKA
jgi:DNA replication protein DnaC